ncbi:MAG: Crp/Fnr family transcriptional regulator [Anaerolineales bacterium]|nr:Crp/Fnr family transcriptional regulator [Anaerolineales bacterium]
MPTQPVSHGLDQHLRASPYFRSLDERALRKLAEHATCQEYAAGEVIFLEGDPSAGLYYLQSGWVKIVKTSPEGREQVLQFLGPGEVFNAIAVFTSRPNPATALALEVTKIWLLHRDAVADLVRHRPEVAQRVIEDMADRLVRLVELVEDLSLRSVTGRLARMLLDGATGDVLHRPRWYTQAELAGQLGTVPDVVQRALGSLAAAGLIQVERQFIRLQDRPALEKLAA